MGENRSLSRSSMGASASRSAIEVELHLHKTVGRPRAVQIKGVVVVKEAGGLENRLFQWLLVVSSDQTVEIGHLVDIAGRRTLDFGAAERERLLQLFRIGF